MALPSATLLRSTPPISVHLWANGQYAVEAINRAIAVALERSDLGEHEGGYAPAEPDTYRTYL
ncbi:hypothetical protein [Halalkalicoccus paucihalophilus]|uniref:hypothetical protein n=1 Tax=Halalkalicoccus paucihalophilus TaxID=1008153 RepID=UPI0008351E1A|nr:hypothetical protein [Halalkalicoccus paucihalophilus]